MKKIGIYNPNLAARGGGEKVCLALAEALAGQYSVTLITSEAPKKGQLEEYFGVSLKGVDISVIHTSRVTNRIYRMRLPEIFRNSVKNVDLYRKIRKLNLDVFVNNAYNTEIPAPAPIGVYMCMFPHKIPNPNEMGLVKKVYAITMRTVNKLIFPTHKFWLDTYQVITANSVFTQSYIKKYWARESDIIYPICDSANIEGVSKEKIILNVGRFFHNNGITHHKRQDFLIDAFIDLHDLHAEGWQLHFAGTVTDDYYDMIYALDMMRRADGYPIFFHFDAPLDSLRALYSKAQVYWHATGYGSDARKSPERQEHFGISTVEAMSTGAIPVVIKSAGQKEVIEEGVNGYLWENEEELKGKTILAIRSGMDRRLEAKKSAELYAKSAFHKKALEIFSQI